MDGVARVRACALAGRERGSPDKAASPAGARVLFFNESAERFAYYGMRALLILYLIDKPPAGLGWSQERPVTYTLVHRLPT